MSDTEQNLEPTTETAPVAVSDAVAAGTAHLSDDVAAPKPPGPSQEERGFQRKFNQLDDSLRPLKGYLENQQLGGPKGVATILANTERLWAQPELAKVMQGFLATGQVEFPKAQRSTGNDFDAYADEPEAKPWETETQSLKAEVAGLRQMLQGVQKSAGLRSITEHTSKFAREYPMTPDEKSRFEEAMDSRIDRLTSTPQGIQIIQSMSWDDYRSMALPAIEDFRDAISERKRNQQRAANAARATDAPGIGTGGDETAPSKMPRNRAELALQAKRALRAVSG